MHSHVPPSVLLAIGMVLVTLKGGLLLFAQQQRRKLAVLKSYLARYRAGDYAAALQAVEGLRNDPSQYCFLRAGALMELGNMEEARKLLEQSIALVESRLPANLGHSGRPPKPGGQQDFVAHAWGALGELHRAQGRFDEAVRCFETSLRWSPGRGGAHREIAETLLSKGGHSAEALKWATLALQEDRASKMPVRELSTLNVGEDLAVLAWAVAVTSPGDHAQVDRLVDEGLREVGNSAVSTSAEVHYHAGLAYEALGDHHRSGQHWDEAARIDPQGRWGRAARAIASSAR